MVHRHSPPFTAAPGYFVPHLDMVRPVPAEYQLARRLMRLRSGGHLFEGCMSRGQTIRANDHLRKYLRGGRVEVSHGPYELDDRTIGRMLCVLARYDKFDSDSLHDQGCFIFAGFAFVWRIEVVGDERVLR